MDKELFKDWFHFHQSSRRGIWVLIGLIGLTIFMRFFLPPALTPKRENLALHLPEIKSWTMQMSLADTSAFQTSQYPKSEEIIPKYSLFNPNEIDDDQWREFGFREGQIKSIRKYLDSGREFRSKEDLSKMYVIGKDQYESIYAYIDLPDTSPVIPNPRTNYSNDVALEAKKIYQAIEINSTDSISLLNLPGIGPFYAGAIIKYRNRLGGYVSIQQLGEVWKMKPETIEKITPEITLNTELVKKININICTYEELSKHPYVSFKQVKALISYREKHGAFKSIEDIKKSLLIDETTYTKLLPYLSL